MLQMETVERWLLAAVLTPVWEWVRTNWAGFWWSRAVIWVSLFWIADLVLGLSRAVADGLRHPKDPERGVKVWRIFRSVKKMLVYLGCLSIAWGLRESHGTGLWLPAGCLEAGILLREGASVLRHLGYVSDSPALQKMLCWYAEDWGRKAGKDQELESGKSNK